MNSFIFFIPKKKSTVRLEVAMYLIRLDGNINLTYVLIFRLEFNDLPRKNQKINVKYWIEPISSDRLIRSDPFWIPPSSNTKHTCLLNRFSVIHTIVDLLLNVRRLLSQMEYEGIFLVSRKKILRTIATERNFFKKFEMKTKKRQQPTHVNFV